MRPKNLLCNLTVSRTVAFKQSAGPCEPREVQWRYLADSQNFLKHTRLGQCILLLILNLTVQLFLSKSI